MRGERFFFILISIFFCGNLLANITANYFWTSGRIISIYSLLFFFIVFICLLILLLLIKPLLRRKRYFLFLLIFSCGCGSISNHYSNIPSNFKPKITIKSFQERCEQSIIKILPENHTPSSESVLLALTLGDKSQIDYKLKNKYRLSGAMHVLALSGLHIAIVYMILSWIFSFLGKSMTCTWVRSLSIIILLCLYAFLTNLRPSVCRAVLMTCIYEICKITERSHFGLNTLALSALIIIIINPIAPTDIGFQLSYGAMLGIFLIYPILKDIPFIAGITDRKTKLEKQFFKLWNLISVSLSCQFTTIPLLWMYFKTISVYSIFSSLVAIPLTTLIVIQVPIGLINSLIDYPIKIMPHILELTINLLNYFISHVT